MAQTGKPKVLLVDDDDAVTAFMAVKLAPHYRVVSTHNPSAVVQMAAQERPDVILCDINMPGTQGDEVAYLLSQNDITDRIPLIYLSGLISPGETAELDAVFGDHPAVSKSAPLPELLEAIDKALRR